MELPEFTKKFGSIFEHSAWVAEQAHSIWRTDYSGELNLLAVHSAMVSAFRNASEAERLDVLKAHPDLAGKLAQAKRLTKASTTEQASAGLDALTDDERTTFTALNKRYVEKFDFPFIIAVRDHTKSSILSAFQERIEHAMETEFAEGCYQVERIAYHRLKGMFADG